MFILDLGMVSFSQSLSRTSVRETCLSKKKTFCSGNQGEVWQASDYSYQGQNCAEVLDKLVYNCEKGNWNSCEELCKEAGSVSAYRNRHVSNLKRASEVVHWICNNAKCLDNCEGVDENRCNIYNDFYERYH